MLYRKSRSNNIKILSRIGIRPHFSYIEASASTIQYFKKLDHSGPTLVQFSGLWSNFMDYLKVTPESFVSLVTFCHDVNRIGSLVMVQRYDDVQMTILICGLWFVVCYLKPR